MDQLHQAIIASCSSFFLVAAVICLLILILRWRRMNAVGDDQDQPPPSAVEESYTPFDPSLQLSMKDIVAATNNFSGDKKIGETSFASVHKAELADGRNLTVMRLRANSYHSDKEFRSELENLGKLRHRNIVRMRGYCESGENKVLIYNFFEKGSLDICLRSGSLSWEDRVKVVRGVANGLAYMHELEKPIIHRNVNPEAILLGQDLEAHIYDFGFAKLVESSRVSTNPVGPTVYTPPEYFGSREATTKGDVYSFGVLMIMAIASREWLDKGRKSAISKCYPQGCLTCKSKIDKFFVILKISKINYKDSTFVSHDEDVVGLVRRAQDVALKNREMEMLDPRIGSISDWAEVKKYVDIALKCVQPGPKDRPTMREVVELLKDLS